MTALAVVWAMQGWFGALLVISDGITTFPRPRKTEQRCCLEMGFFLCDDSVQPMEQMYSWTHSGFVLVWFRFFSLQDLMLCLVSQDPAWVRFPVESFMNFSNCTLAPPHPPLTTLSLLTFLLASRLFWPRSPKSAGVAQTAQVAVLPACSLC